MVTKPKWMTLEFWAALVSAAVMVLVTLGILSQEEAATWKELATGLIAAVLPIVALVLGYSNLRAQLVMAGLTAEDAPAWLTAEFWMTLIATGTMVLVAARIVTQEQADVWQQLLGPLVAAVLAIAAYIRGRVVVATQARVMGLR
ncbi:membrane protein of unknown function [Candidatus Promineifilum breve]|uniref:Uncharacterized protein n=1 Tax=Candidatus Promineifilum breve TaxID=1806508 RepID=A0A160T3A9_9CHLR|nr:hypothetical protein [Candidatus Promineifilum breve]CUS04254.2 membrane protein of unknown function [Candidatus Promineifilum breve]